MQFPNLCGTLRCIDKLMTTDAFMIIFKMWVQRSASDENWASEWLLGGEGRSGDIMWVQKLNQGQGHLCQILLLPLKIGYKQWKQTFLLAQDGAWDQLTSGTYRVCPDQRPWWSFAYDELSNAWGWQCCPSRPATSGSGWPTLRVLRFRSVRKHS